MADYLTTDAELTSVADAIRTKGGTSASLAYPAGFVSAIEAIPTGGGTPKTVTITLTSPRHSSEAKNPCCIIYESDTMSVLGTQIGQIESPTGNTTVTMTKPLLNAKFFSNAYVSPGSIIFGTTTDALKTDTVNDLAVSVLVFSDGEITIDGTNYDD